MAENKNSFLFYTDWIDTFKNLGEKNGYELLMHILAYVNDENPTSDNPIVNAVFPIMENTLKRDLKKWKKSIEQKSKAGKASAEARRKNKPEIEQPLTDVDSVERNSTKPTVSVSDSVSDSVSEEVVVKYNYSIYDDNNSEIIWNITNEQFWLSLARKHKKNLEELKGYWNDFWQWQQTKGYEPRTAEDIRNHFSNQLPSRVSKDLQKAKGPSYNEYFE